MSGIWYAKPACIIRALDKIGNESIETFLTIGYRKTLPKKTKERIEEFFHLLFSVDAFNRHWARIYQSYYSDNSPVMIFFYIVVLFKNSFIKICKKRRSRKTKFIYLN